MKLAIGILFVCVSATYGFLFPSKSGPEWNSLRITWGPNPFSSHYYAKQPLTVSDAKKNGFEQLPGPCQGKFLGQRFIQGKDVSLVLIYDSKGDIAGSQMAIPASMITDKYYRFSEQTMYNRDTIAGVDVYVLTAYFVDPSTICQANPSAPARPKGITGTGLWMQNGTDPIRDSFQSPINESDVHKTQWVQGACFPSMGVHYWLGNWAGVDCAKFFPAFLMYNKGKLTGFGWATAGKFEYSSHTEFPPYAALNSFLKPVPDCMPKFFEETGGFTTMHIYFNAEPWNLLC